MDSNEILNTFDPESLDQSATPYQEIPIGEMTFDQGVEYMKQSVDVDDWNRRRYNIKNLHPQSHTLIGYLDTSGLIVQVLGMGATIRRY